MKDACRKLRQGRKHSYIEQLMSLTVPMLRLFLLTNYFCFSLLIHTLLWHAKLLRNSFVLSKNSQFPEQSTCCTEHDNNWALSRENLSLGFLTR